jgi:hypothetical protein
MGRQEERKNFAKPTGRSEDDDTNVVRNVKGLGCIRPGKFDLSKRPWNLLERSPETGKFY